MVRTLSEIDLDLELALALADVDGRRHRAGAADLCGPADIPPETVEQAIHLPPQRGDRIVVADRHVGPASERTKDWPVHLSLPFLHR
jgi:hypothetical protein